MENNIYRDQTTVRGNVKNMEVAEGENNEVVSEDEDPMGLNIPEATPDVRFDDPDATESESEYQRRHCPVYKQEHAYPELNIANPQPPVQAGHGDHFPEPQTDI